MTRSTSGEPRWVTPVVRPRSTRRVRYTPWYRQTVAVPVWMLLLLLAAGTFYWITAVWP